MERGVGAGEQRRVARRGVRHHLPELHARGLPGEECHQRRRILPEDVRVVGPAVREAQLLGQRGELDQARGGRVGQDGDAEAEHGIPWSCRPGKRHSATNSRSPRARCCRSRSASTRAHRPGSSIVNPADDPRWSGTARPMGRGRAYAAARISESTASSASSSATTTWEIISSSMPRARIASRRSRISCGPPETARVSTSSSVISPAAVTG